MELTGKRSRDSITPLRELLQAHANLTDISGLQIAFFGSWCYNAVGTNTDVDFAIVGLPDASNPDMIDHMQQALATAKDP